MNQQQYQYPEMVLREHPGEVREIKKLAARCGRTLAKRDDHRRARARLVARLEKVENAHLRYWAEVVVIDHRWCGATGQGGFWAAASRCVNEDAAAILQQRNTEGSAFEVLAQCAIGPISS